MNDLIAHPKIIFEVLVAYWAFSAVVSGMPDPPLDSFYYKWLYATLHAFAGNLKQFADNKIEALEQTTVVKTTSTSTMAGSASTGTDTKP